MEVGSKSSGLEELVKAVGRLVEMAASVYFGREVSIIVEDRWR